MKFLLPTLLFIASAVTAQPTVAADADPVNRVLDYSDGIPLCCENHDYISEAGDDVVAQVTSAFDGDGGGSWDLGELVAGELSHDEEHVQVRRFEYNWIDGAELLEKYSPGGYHPIMIDDVLRGRYRIVDKLGFGGYSTVWLALDTCRHRYVTVKVSIADTPLHETNILRALATPGHESIPTPLDRFELRGPNGTHRCYTMIPAQCDLREASFSRLFPIEVARALSGSLTLAIAYIHSRGMFMEVSDDIHLRNILVKLPSDFDHLSVDQLYEEYGKPETVTITQRDGKQLPPNIPPKTVLPLYLGKYAEEFSLSDTQVLPSNFGEAFAPDLEPRCGKDCHTPLAMRPPEARFEPEAPLSYSADIWSLATAIWEILGMQPIFSTEFASADELISQQIDVLGPLPSSWWMQWPERSQFFDNEGRPKEGRYVWSGIELAFDECVQEYRRKSSCEFNTEEVTAIIDLMRRMMAFWPEELPTVYEVLQSEWMVKWALPELARRSQMK
ncbi:kinase-like protein [Aspergillus sclerotioniger CBS 115572]|uniref:non-specific serine/threonine protein kinase n=1 Tax=Aspergillus sclerotioniger CBS 115572 TaxID=1450535 RepID=A0A317W4Q5_9EURO|nr:kinase-like protein [Aspergillus sclerotioniger CBS 115572]PWY81554.1 kinase-like protein [Aspergillus sclerotioniger CBS 115572]